jgi:hypothetical protein
VCSSREFGKHRSSPPYPVVVARSLSGSSAETYPPLVTLPIAMLWLAETPASSKHPILPIQFNINF